MKTALKTFTIVTMTALSLAACGSSNSKGNPTNSNDTTPVTDPNSGATTGTVGTNPADPNGASVLSTNSPIVATTAANGSISLPYAIYAEQTAATDPTKQFGIQFSDYDPCTQGSLYGWTTFPGTQSYSVLGFYFPAAPAVQTYTIGTDILIANGALGEKFTNNAQVCTATTWDQLASGTVNITAVSGNNLTGTMDITLASGDKVSGNFQTGSCSATATGGATNPDTSGQCTSEK